MLVATRRVIGVGVALRIGEIQREIYVGGQSKQRGTEVLKKRRRSGAGRATERVIAGWRKWIAHGLILGSSAGVHQNHAALTGTEAEVTRVIGRILVVLIEVATGRRHRRVGARFFTIEDVDVDRLPIDSDVGIDDD